LVKLTPRPTKRVLKALQRGGWTLRRSKPGAKHYVLEHSDKPRILVIPRHSRIKKGTLGAVIKQAGLTLDEFEEMYRG